MDMLRLTLLIVGLIVIVAIYLYYREPSDDKATPVTDKPSFITKLKALFSRQSSSATEDDDEAWIRPKVTEEDFAELGHIVARRSNSEDESLDEEMHIDWDSSTPVAPEDELVLVFHIMAGQDNVFMGESLQSAFDQAGFIYGDKQIYHYYGEGLNPEGEAVCSITNVLEPGYFEPKQFSDFTTPGLTLFMQLPGPVEARRAFDTTLAKAKQLANLLEAELRDESRNGLTDQSIGHMKEKVEAFRFKQQVAALKQRRH